MVTDSTPLVPAGGVPVKDKAGKVVGAMGISGMAEFDDEALAQNITAQF